MLFSSIPAELRDRVCDFLSDSDQLALAATSSAFLPIAQRRLYRHLSLSPASKNLPVVALLARNHHLARYVRSITLSVPNDACILHAFYRHLAKALSLMTELTSLEMSIDPAASWILSQIGTSSFRRLTRFSATFQFDSHVTDFLHRTPALSELELDYDPVASHTDSIPPLPLSALSALSEFTGPSHAAKAIVPGRPVQCIHITSGDLTPDTVQSFRDATADVVMLSASTSAQPVPLLQTVAQNLPRIVYLRVLTTYPFTEAPNAAFHDSVANVLNSLPALASFDLSGMHWGSFRKPQEGDKRVWQSQPLTADSPREVDIVIDDDDLHFDEFFAY